MGLLDSVIGMVTGQPGEGGGRGGNAALISALLALLLQNRGGNRQGADGADGPGGLGDLGGLLGGLLGGGGGGAAAGAGMGAGGLGSVLGGGLGVLLEQLQRGGLGDAVGSWVGTGPNAQISGDQLENAIGPDILGQLARQFGLPMGEVTGQLSQILPQMVDQATPQGRMPEGGFGDIGDLLGQLTQRS